MYNKEEECKLYVKNLPLDIDEATLRSLFEPFGEITTIYFVKTSSGMPHGSAMIMFTTYKSVSDAYNAFLKSAQTLPGASYPIHVIIPNAKSHQRQLLEAKASSGYVLKNSAPDNVSEITETDVTSRSLASEVDDATRGNQKLSKREMEDCNSSIPRKRLCQEEKNSFSCNDYHVARIYMPLPRPQVTGKLSYLCFLTFFSKSLFIAAS